MKRILILILGLFGVAQAQFAPTSAKTAFKNGVSLGTRDSSAYVAADSLVVVINRQGRMMYRSTDGYWKILANAAAADYVPYTGAVTNVNLGNFRLTARSLKTDSIYANSSAGMYLLTNGGAAVAHWGGGGSVEVDFKGFAGYDANRAGSYTVRSFTDKNYVDSSAALRVRYTDTAAMLAGYKTYYPRTAISAGTGISYNPATGVITNSSPSSGGTVTSVAASAGTGISVSGSPITSSGTLTITNTAPDQTVTLTAGSGISVTGTYPNFTVANTSPSSGGTVTSVSAGIGMSFTAITSSGAVNADTTVLATRAYAAGLDVAKANTSLNNVNGVLSSTYGGAGSVSGILKANGSGVVSAAVNNTDYTLLNGTGFVRMSGTTPSYVTGTSSQFVKADGSLDGTSYATAASLSGYLPLSGGTLTGTLNGLTINGRSIRNNGVGTFGFNSAGNGEMQMYATADGGLVMAGRGSVNDVTITNRSGSDVVQIPTGTINVNLLGSLSGTSLSMSGGTQLATSSGRVLIKTTTDNGTDALQVAGSGRFSSSLAVSANSGGDGIRIVGRAGDGFGFLTFRNNANTATNGEIGISDSQNMLFYTGASVKLTIASTGAATFSSSVTASDYRGSTASYSSAGTISANITTAFLTGNAYTINMPTATNGKVLIIIAETGLNTNGITLNGVNGGTYLLSCHHSLVLVGNGTTWKIASDYQTSVPCS